MKRIIPCLLFATLLFGASQPPCPKQDFLPWADCPAPIDPSRIAVDPYSGQQLCLGWQYARAGQPWRIDGWACDPDGDPMQITTSIGTLTEPTPGAYSITGVAYELGPVYVDITVRDSPPDPNEAITVTGTRVIVVLPVNRPPVVGCGGRP